MIDMRITCMNHHMLNNVNRLIYSLENTDPEFISRGEGVDYFNALGEGLREADWKSEWLRKETLRSLALSRSIEIIKLAEATVRRPEFTVLCMAAIMTKRR